MKGRSFLHCTALSYRLSERRECRMRQAFRKHTLTTLKICIFERYLARQLAKAELVNARASWKAVLLRKGPCRQYRDACFDGGGAIGGMLG
jgi:hypothetical protein